MSDALPEVRWSWLRGMMRSPAHCKYGLDNGAEETAAMRLGTAVHFHLLGGEKHEPVLFEGKARRGKEWEAFKAAHQGRTILTEPEWAKSEAIAESVFATPHAMDRLTGETELELNWEIAGRKCGARADALNIDVVELKTGWDVNPARYYWLANRMGYLGQLGWYYDGVVACGRPAPRVACIIGVESLPPYPVVVYDLGPNALDQGRKQARLLFERLRQCEESNEWPGYAQSPIVLEAPDAGDDLVLDFGGDEPDAEAA